MEEERNTRTTTPPAGITIPKEWSDASNSITFDSSSTPISFICGPKNSGKSTFSRHLLNTLLLRYKKVAYLDTDVGQPEFTTPGCLSLTMIDQATPDFTVTTLKTPERCYFFGDISSKRDPESYVNCVIALRDYYKKESSSSRKSRVSLDVPLIVNTPGWVKGMGLHVLLDMLKHIAPTHVVKINLSSADNYLKENKLSPEDKNLPSGVFWENVDGGASVHLIEITSVRDNFNDGQVFVQEVARRLREQRLIAYFRKCFPSDMNVTTKKELARALASHTPYQVPIPHLKIQHLHCEVPSTEVLYSLNASIVGLAVSPGDSESLPVCVGLGIVRSIDIMKNLLYVITPIPQSILASIDVLLQGFIQIPTSLLQVRGCVSPYMSANVLPEEWSKEKEKEKKRKKEAAPED